jgi:NAD dependent epimerase/dehydratase
VSHSLRDQTVLVTGAGGFIGSHLAEALVARGCQVRALIKYNSRSDWGNLERLPKAVRDAIEVVSGDIADPYLVRHAVAGCQTVFHLAALIGIPYSYVAPQHYLNVNLQGTLNVLEACRSEKVGKLVHTSTSETYGTAQYTPIDEKHPLVGQSPYSASKIGADKLAESYWRSFDLPVATIRPFNTFGPRQSARAVIPTLISQALALDSNGHTIRVGSLDPKRDFTYVTDTVAGFMAVAESDASIGETINVGTGQCVSIGDTLDAVLAVVGVARDAVQVVSESQRVRPEASEVFLLQCDATKAKTLLGWAPQVTLAQGIAHTVAAHRAAGVSDRVTQYHI